MTDMLNSEPDQIARAFQQLVSERKKLTKIVTKEEAAEKARDKASVEAASTLTIERIVKESADLQLTVDRTAEELAKILLAETASWRRCAGRSRSKLPTCENWPTPRSPPTRSTS